ncbi:PDDEXK nuclease domain-containing protein [Zhenpiania hominis]|uniref:PDDEXK nuclease domain-containing protein n=1 Tax=Zhenpiania hominis TaxID=2763644 RepID=UPI0039F4D710
MTKKEMTPIDHSFLESVAKVLTQARENAKTAVNLSMVYAYFEIGRMIVEEEQHGANRAAYGTQLLKELSLYLTQQFGKGYSAENLKLMRRFYMVYSQDQIGETVFTQFEDLPVVSTGRKFFLSWSHYLKLMRIANIEERHFYEIEAVKNDWSLSELKRQYNSSLYERLALSTDKEKVYRLSEEGQTVKTPSDYNRLLRCFVLFDLKIGELKHQDIGQMQMYVHYYDRKVKLPDENPTIGIVLCKDKNNAIVEMTLPEDNAQIFASKYETVLPSKESLQKLLQEQMLDVSGDENE